jgi:UDP-N-acetyl-D-mannosaminuronic acid dehydrogenase
MSKKIAIIGGCGHVGIPLGLAFASKGIQVTLVDINAHSVGLINSGRLPFLEAGAEPLLQKHVGKNLMATTDTSCVPQHEVVVFVTGTPVDEHHNPRVHDVTSVINHYLPYLSPKQLIILRSTVYPGVVECVDQLLRKHSSECKLAFCPERIVQGRGIEEIFSLPQIVSGTTQVAEDEAAKLFASLTETIIRLRPMEAELAKLMTNAWRYLEFSVANQFYLMTESCGLDFFKIFDALKYDYPRAKHFKGPGLAAGPCLFKDTMQLSAFHKNNFFLGQAAMLINEGLPSFLVDQLEHQLGTLKNKKIAIMGMTFKPDNDDIRESLSFKLKKILQFKMAIVLASDPHYLVDTVNTEQALREAEGFILGVPHTEYRDLKITKPFVDCWGVWRKREVQV